ncbi:helix-turn-helix transcriptional regulator [uncultured Thiothrix sp.]|uniref:helix-turn-helix domain-containing protein n=1 Tax=uncultured Thiothrix sp. TaxID=223185 RepID=UPI002631C7D5|nr:helix-turn-helix transcriptional regulator [uncultured Thiothrix sp.]HMT93056.1 helix-turn-helix transcriptional regulator [Thiolinea sp.]
MLVAKREMGETFQKRLQILLQRSGLNKAQFAESIGVNRSALAQLMSDQLLRLPRAETLCSIASTYSVSIDWLLGLSQDEHVSSAVSSAMEIEQVINGQHTKLGQWHRDAIGYKIRYVPANLPDSLMIEAVIDYERQATQVPLAVRKLETNSQLAYNRIDESEMEVCLPLQRLKMLAQGVGIWEKLPKHLRRQQLEHIQRLLDDLYPTYRLFLYDGRKIFSAPLTIFGSQRSVIYVGDMYIVINTLEEIRALTRHFDRLIRNTEVNPHESAEFIQSLLETYG